MKNVRKRLAQGLIVVGAGLLSCLSSVQATTSGIGSTISDILPAIVELAVIGAMLGLVRKFG